MKKLFISVMAIVFLSFCCLSTGYAKNESNLPLGVDIKGNVSLGNTNANISLGGYMAPLKNAKNYIEAFYAYYNPPFYYLGGASDLRNEDKQGLIKYTRRKIDDTTHDTTVDVLSYGFNCMNINNYKDEWIFFMKNNDGYIYKVKTDGTKETKLELPFFVRRFLIVNDRLIIETQFYEYGKILSADLDGADLRLIAKGDSRCGDMMIQADEKGIYYYDDVNLEIKRISYDGKEEILIFKGRETNGAPIKLFQVSNNRIIIRTYNHYYKERLILLDLDEPLEISNDFDGYFYDADGVRWDIGLPFFKYQIIYNFGDACFNFSADGFYVYSSIMPSKFVLGLYEETFYKDDFMAYKIELNTIEELIYQVDYEGNTRVWKDDVFYKGYVDLQGGSDYNYSLYVLNNELYLYDPVRYLNITGLSFYSDHQISYREPNYIEPNKN